MNEFDWSFLTSTRFYGNLIIAIGTWFQVPNPFTISAFGAFLMVFGGLFVAVGTLDRGIDRLAEMSDKKTVATISSSTTTAASDDNTTTAKTTTENTTTVSPVVDVQNEIAG